MGTGGGLQLTSPAPPQPCLVVQGHLPPQAPSRRARGRRPSRTECDRLTLDAMPLLAWPLLSRLPSCPAPGPCPQPRGTGEGAHGCPPAVPRVPVGAGPCSALPAVLSIRLPLPPKGRCLLLPWGRGGTAEQAQVGAEPCGSPLPTPPAPGLARQPLRQGPMPSCSWLVPSPRAQILGSFPVHLPGHSGPKSVGGCPGQLAGVASLGDSRDVGARTEMALVG